MKPMSKILSSIAGLAFAALAAGPAPAQQFPDHAIRIIVGFTPGGAPDLTARIVADKLTVGLGQPVVVENRAGANGNIAAELVAKSAPDGYTLLLANDTMLVINPHLYKMTFDPLKDLAPVASAVSNQFYISVNPSLPVKDFAEFIAYARKASPPVAYGSAGVGSMHHLSMELLKQRAGINLLHVPYRGGTAAATGVLAGDVQAMSSGGSSAPLIKSGKLHGLATTGKTRSPLFPDMPTVAEFYPGYEATIWLGLFAPAGTPEPVIARLRGEMNKLLATDEVKNRMQSSGGMDPYISEPQEFSALIRSDYEKYGRLIQAMGMKPK